MKKHFIVLISMLILITLVGCSADSNNEETTKIEAVKAEVLSVKDANESLKTEITALIQENENLKAEIKALAEENEARKTELINLSKTNEETIAMLKDKIADLEAQLTK